MAIVGITSPPYATMISGNGSVEYVEKRLKEGRIKSEVVKKRLNNLVKNRETDISMKGMIESSYGKTVGQIGALGGELGVSEERIEVGCNGVWHGCYEDGKYRKYFSNESLRHPAKISPILVLKILNHLSQQDMLGMKDIVLDIFSGSGRVPLIAAMRGYASVGIELEQDFYDMSLRNQKYMEDRLGRKLPCTILKGDSRDIVAVMERREVNNIEIERDYKTAMTNVYRSAFMSGVNPLIVILKNPTKDGKIQRLDLLTKNIVENSGFELYDYHKALLFEEAHQMTLDGNIKKKAFGRLSMYQRMCFNKGGNLARHEDCLFFRKSLVEGKENGQKTMH